MKCGARSGQSGSTRLSERKVRAEKSKTSQRAKKDRQVPRADKESARWAEGVIEASRRLRDAGVQSIHVLDQEGDDYALFGELIEADCRFVIRGSSARWTNRADQTSVQEQLERASIVAERTVALSSRKKPSPNHSARHERQATLSIRATRVSIPRPQHAQSTLKSVKLNVVQVVELNPPAGLEPVAWTLYTTEPIDTAEQIIAVVDHYRARWRIEEFFKALKSGCALEKRQLTTIENLLRMVAISLPIAWSLLAIRVMANQPAPVAAKSVFSPVQLVVLSALCAQIRYRRLPEKDATVRDAMLAIAALAGHIRGNGDPGWHTLAFGLQRLMQAEEIMMQAEEIRGALKAAQKKGRPKGPPHL